MSTLIYSRIEISTALLSKCCGNNSRCTLEALPRNEIWDSKQKRLVLVGFDITTDRVSNSSITIVKYFNLAFGFS